MQPFIWPRKTPDETHANLSPAHEDAPSDIHQFVDAHSIAILNMPIGGVPGARTPRMHEYFGTCEVRRGTF